MGTVLLVHGAWHGGWCWAPVARALRRSGHEVFAPTLTGIGERSHLADPSIDLDTHLADLLAVLEYEDLRDVTVVGHSYAGMFLERLATSTDRVGALLYLDAFLPRDGECALDLVPAEVRERMERTARTDGGGWGIPPSPLESLGLTEPTLVGWVQPRLVPQPIRTYQQPVALPDGLHDLPMQFILCTDWKCVFRPYAERARQRGATVIELDTGHEAMVEAPDRVAELIDAFVCDLDRAPVAAADPGPGR